MSADPPTLNTEPGSAWEGAGTAGSHSESDGQSDNGVVPSPVRRSKRIKLVTPEKKPAAAQKTKNKGKMVGKK